jgi:class 3 adenylate cyclase/tetratricopeptide (TPR) repeat protein/ribosomal protein L40E
MQCLTCKAILPDEAKFCVACGAPARIACSKCGSQSPSHAKFCRECGASLAARAVEDVAPFLLMEPPVREPAGMLPERRQLTVLFCDLVGSTAMSIRLDPEDLRDVIGAYHRCVAETVLRFDGFVARYMGDGALIYFGYPHGHEDNAERAVRAALALVSNIGKLELRIGRLQSRIGIATGLVVVGEMVNAGAAREQMALGEAPNLAARLQTLATPDTIVIAENTRRLVGGLFDYRELGEIPLKGFEDPVRAWQVIGKKHVERDAERSADAASRVRGATSATPLVGREQERGLLRDRWEHATEGEGRVVLLNGEAGVGKSRLVQALLADVANEPHARIEFRCSAHCANSPLYPVVRLLKGTLGWNPEDTDATRQEKLEFFCAQNRVSTEEGVPLLASLLSLPSSVRFPLPPMSPERQKQRTLQTLLAVVLKMAAEEPVLLVAEDLHWIDPTTMELLTLLVNQMATVRLFALFTARLDFVPAWPMHSYVTSLMLTRFTRRQTEQMVEHVARGKPLPAEVVKEIVAKTDGVPLFVEELTKMVLESGLVHEQEDRYQLAGPLLPLAIPTTLHDSLTARLDRLATVKVVAQLSAALGREFSYALLKAVSALDDATLQRELARLVDAELLYQHGGLPEATYVFKHALIQEAAYQSLLKSTRQQYHERIARVVVEQFATDAESRPEFVAIQYTEAGNPDAAVRWWQKAGQQAFRRASYAEAIAHYTKGLGVLETMPASEQHDQSELDLQVELGYALIPLKGWAAPTSAEAFTRAGTLCTRLGDTPKQFRALWGLGAFHFVRGDQYSARQVADQCLSVARRANDVDALIEAHYLSGIVWCAMGNLESGHDDLGTCIRLYGDEERPLHRMLYGQDAKASALGWLAMALWTRGRPDDAMARANEALDLVRNSTQPFLLARGLASVGFVDVFRREPQGPDSPLSAALALCDEQGFVYFNAVVSAFQGTNLVHLGRTEEGIALTQASLAALRRIGSELLFTLILGNLGSAHLALKQVDEGLAAVADGLRCVEKNGERWGEAELYRVRGELFLIREPRDVAAAEASFTRAIEIARQQQAKSYQLRAASSLAKLWCRRGKRAEARSVLAQNLDAWPDGLDSADLRDARAVLRQLG